MHGALGFTDECDLGLYLKRALHQANWLGSEAAMRVRYHEEILAVAETSAFADAEVDTSEPRDGNWAQMSEQEFRRMVRNFLRRYFPERLRHRPHRLHWAECKEWYLTLSRRGWIAPAWPREHGGMGLPGDKLIAFIDEMEDYGVPRLPDQGIINLGPILIRFGTPEQRRDYLPKILSGEHIWCQGYSEPNAGSDLASLRTQATLDGDAFVVNGQKIWTTLAQDATHMFALVRTAEAPRKQEGISFLLLDLSSPGIAVRPIRNIVGEEEFCEVFFDNVRVPRRNLVGELNEGWKLAKALLGFERLFVGSPKTAQYAMKLLRRVAEARGLFEKEAFVAQYAQLALDVADLKATYARFANVAKGGGELPESVSILKIWASETYTAITRFIYESCEEDGGSIGDVEVGATSLNVSAPLMNAMITTIYAGSNEIQRNILAKTVLKLPS
jgi:alkylation response protein AidB-like acyl-CoA dehydrogenase